jgi:L-alanine-DL-glutamate epimerase-like enolase superfamily enzyme
MKITNIETMHADAGWRSFSFLKIETDESITGWSEFSDINEAVRIQGLSALIMSFKDLLLGQDPRNIELLTNNLFNATRQSLSGLNHQAVGAIQNALIDLTAKSLNVPVYRMFGGPVRNRIPLYWSHFGTYRLYPQAQDFLDLTLITNLEEFANHALDAKKAGYRALKTKIHLFDDKGGYGYFPSFGMSPGGPELNLEPRVLNSIIEQMSALRDVVGDDFDLILDVNSNFRTEGFIRIARAMEKFNLRWLEIDSFDPDAMATIRRHSSTPIGGCEMICTARTYRPFFSMQALDVPLVYVAWNGFMESLRIAALADAYDTNVTAHNFTSHLATQISGHFAAVTPNMQIMEFDPDEVTWLHEYFTQPLVIENGELVLSERPGWGMDVNEAAVRDRPAGSSHFSIKE